VLPANRTLVTGFIPIMVFAVLLLALCAISASLSLVHCVLDECEPVCSRNSLFLSRLHGYSKRGCGVFVLHPLSPVAVGHQSSCNRLPSNKLSESLVYPHTLSVGSVPNFILTVFLLYPLSLFALAYLRCGLVVAICFSHEKVCVGCPAEPATFYGKAGDLSNEGGWCLASHVSGISLVPPLSPSPHIFSFCLFMVICLSCSRTVARIGCWLPHARSYGLIIPLPSFIPTAGLYHLVDYFSALSERPIGELCCSPKPPLPFFSNKTSASSEDLLACGGLNKLCNLNGSPSGVSGSMLGAFLVLPAGAC